MHAIIVHPRLTQSLQKEVHGTHHLLLVASDPLSHTVKFAGQSSKTIQSATCCPVQIRIVSDNGAFVLGLRHAGPFFEHQKQSYVCTYTADSKDSACPQTIHVTASWFQASYRASLGACQWATRISKLSISELNCSLNTMSTK